MKLYALHTDDGYLKGIVIQETMTGDPFRRGYWGERLDDTDTLSEWDVPVWVAYVLSDMGYGFTFDVLNLDEPEEIPHNGILSDGYDAASLLARHATSTPPEDEQLGWWG
jgi:hypothetical protein